MEACKLSNRKPSSISDSLWVIGQKRIQEKQSTKFAQEAEENEVFLSIDMLFPLPPDQMSSIDS